MCETPRPSLVRIDHNACRQPISVVTANFPSGLTARLIGMLPTSCEDCVVGEIILPVTSGSRCAAADDSVGCGRGLHPVIKTTAVIQPKERNVGMRKLPHDQ